MELARWPSNFGSNRPHGRGVRPPAACRCYGPSAERADAPKLGQRRRLTPPYRASIEREISPAGAERCAEFSDIVTRPKELRPVSPARPHLVRPERAVNRTSLTRPKEPKTDASFQNTGAPLWRCWRSRRRAATSRARRYPPGRGGRRAWRRRWRSSRARPSATSTPCSCPRARRKLK